MSNLVQVVHNMDAIQSIFKDVQAKAVEPNLSVYATYLDNFDKTFRSIAYEAASMQVALESIRTNNSFNNWTEFATAFPQHATQIYVGLGWALAQEQLNPMLYILALPPMLRYRVLDGYGYYEGFFRRRKSTVAQEQLTTDDATALGAYDQGLGRSFWYLSKGNIEGVVRVIESFAVERRSNLWRGLGIAVAYVGGYDRTILEDLLVKSGDYSIELKTGVAMSVISRYVASSVNGDTEQVCQTVCNKLVDDVVAVDTTIKSLLDLAVPNAYKDWIDKLEAKIA